MTPIPDYEVNDIMKYNDMEEESNPNCKYNLRPRKKKKTN